MIIALAALWWLHMASVKVDSHNHQSTRATLLAERQLENLRATAVGDFSAPVSGADASAAIAPFRMTWTVNPVNPWRNDVSVTVTWSEMVRLRGGTARSASTQRVVLQSIRTDLELD